MPLLFDSVALEYSEIISLNSYLDEKMFLAYCLSARRELVINCNNCA